MGFEVLEHTADEGLRIWAPSLDELFAEAAGALVAVQGVPGDGEERSIPIRIEAPDLEALLVDWLSELVYVFEGKNLTPVRVDVRVTEDPYVLEAEVAGPPTDTFQQSGPAVKAVTYHLVEVRRTKDGYEARVYLDI